MSAIMQCTISVVYRENWVLHQAEQCALPGCLMHGSTMDDIALLQVAISLWATAYGHSSGLPP